jgi:hypothetical protein
VRNYHALETQGEENDLEILEDRKLLWNLKTHKEDNIKIYLKEIISKTVNWTNLAKKNDPMATIWKRT